MGSLSEEVDSETIGTATNTSKIELDAESASNFDGGYYYCDGRGDAKNRLLSLKGKIAFTKFEVMQGLKYTMSQIPAVAIASVLNFMVGIPFGASYFPVEWSASESGFPVPGKEALGELAFVCSLFIGIFVKFFLPFVFGVKNKKLLTVCWLV